MGDADVGGEGRGVVTSLGISAGRARLCYVESSALLSALLERDPESIEALRTAGRRVTSALTLAESYRAVLRARVSGRLTAEQEQLAVRALRTFGARCGIVAVSAPILERASRPYPVEPIRTLDAIHLATAEALGEPPQLMTMLTRDSRVRENASRMGYVVEP